MKKSIPFVAALGAVVLAACAAKPPAKPPHEMFCNAVEWNLFSIPNLGKQATVDDDRVTFVLTKLKPLAASLPAMHEGLYYVQRGVKDQDWSAVGIGATKLWEACNAAGYEWELAPKKKTYVWHDPS